MHLEALDRFDHGWARAELEALFADILATYPYVRAGSARPGQITLLFAPAVIGFAARSGLVSGHGRCMCPCWAGSRVYPSGCRPELRWLNFSKDT